MIRSPRRRIVFVCSLSVALLAVLAVFGGAGYGATGVTHAKPVAAEPVPTPASDQYGTPTPFKTKCAQKATVTYNASLKKAKATYKARLKKATTKSAKKAATANYQKALAAAALTKKTSLKKC